MNTEETAAEQRPETTPRGPMAQASTPSHERVLAEELELIRRRRVAAGVAVDQSAQKPAAAGPGGNGNGQSNGYNRSGTGGRAVPADGEEVRHDLVGLALSGGGVRSGAISLGFLMGLTKHRLLRFVDYLSTVSGGGYAGAMVTAEAERMNRANGDASASEDMDTLFREQTAARHSPPPTSRRRLRHLIYNANYLIKNRGWASRALIGTLAMGTMLISALVCACAALAWLCRLAYAPENYDILHAMGFRGDIWVALLPSVVFFALWLTCWLLSYLVNKRRAAGLLARYVFGCWMISLVIGLTLIATTGDLEVNDLLMRLGVSKQLWNELGSVGNAVQTMIVLAILTSLVPYFLPSALFRSGKERAVGPRRFVFRMARMGLLYGIPLLLFGYLASEDISNWNQQRDARLTSSDLMQPAASAAAAKADPTAAAPAATSDASVLPALFYDQLLASVLNKNSPLPQRRIAGRLLDLDFSPRPRSEIGWGAGLQRSVQQMLSTIGLSQQPTPLLLRSPTAELVATSLQKSAQISLQLQALNSDLHSIDDPIWAEQTFGNRYTEKSKVQRFSEFISQLTSGRGRTDLQKTRELRRQRRTYNRSALYHINRRLLDYRRFAGIAAAASSPNANLSPELQQAFDELQQLITLIDGDRLPQDQQNAVTELQRLANAAVPDLTNKTLFQSNPFLQRQVADILDTHESQANLFADFSDPATTDTVTTQETESEAAKRLANQIPRQTMARKVLQINRKILSAAFPYTIHPTGSAAPIFNNNVYAKDQSVRLNIAFVSFLCAVIASLIIDLNATSWHGFYAQQLSDFWINSGQPNEKRISLQSANSIEVGYPYHLINAAVSFLGRPALGEDLIRDENPDDFLLSRLYCGSDHTDVGFVRTAESAYGELTLGDAVALSGSAVSPWATSNQLVRALFLVLNLRTGLWLPHPQTAHANSTILDKIDTHLFPPLRWLALRFLRIPWNRFQQRPPEKWSHLLVTDGGHYENLGVEPLLRRRCRIIVAVDSTEDENYEFSSLAHVINRVRSSEGIEFLQPDSDRPFQFPETIVPDSDSRFSDARLSCIRVRYPARGDQPEMTGLLVLVKSTLLQDDPLELRTVRKRNSAFPNDPTSDQFFSPQTFEAYHRLGVLSADQLANEFKETREEGRPVLSRLLADQPEIAAIFEKMAAADSADSNDRADKFSAERHHTMREHIEKSIDNLTMLAKSVLHDDLADDRHAAELELVLIRLRQDFRLLGKKTAGVQADSKSPTWDVDHNLCDLLADVAAKPELRHLQSAALVVMKLALERYQPKSPVDLRRKLTVLLRLPNTRRKIRQQIEELLPLIDNWSQHEPISEGPDEESQYV